MKTKLILEFGCNHNRIIENAYEMIDQAAELKVWGIKFQKRDLNSMPEHLKYMPRNPKNSFGENYLNHRAALEFSVEQLKQLREYAESKRLVPLISVFDIQSVFDSLDAGFSHVKIPSQLYSNWEINRVLEQIVPNNILYRSTGMHSMSEIISWPYFNSFFDVTFYCRSIYPHTFEQTRFDLMMQIKSSLKTGHFGYSSHDIDGCAIPMAVTLGAEYIERHFTLNRNMKGSDHKTVSSDFGNIQKIIEGIENAEEILNEPALCEAEEKVKKQYRSFY